MFIFPSNKLSCLSLASWHFNKYETGCFEWKAVKWHASLLPTGQSISIATHCLRHFTDALRKPLSNCKEHFSLSCWPQLLLQEALLHSQSFQPNCNSFRRLHSRQHNPLSFLDDPDHPAAILTWVRGGSTSPSNSTECDWCNERPMIGPHVRLCDWWTWKLCCDWCKLQSYICMPQPPPSYMMVGSTLQVT